MNSRHKYNSDEEYRNSLDWYRDTAMTVKENIAETNKKIKEAERKRKNLIDPPKDQERKFHGDCDHPNTMENGPATILYIIVMIGGAIFKERLLLWIFATIVWWCHINRKAIRAKKWDDEHKK